MINLIFGFPVVDRVLPDIFEYDLKKTILTATNKNCTAKLSWIIF